MAAPPVKGGGTVCKLKDPLVVVHRDRGCSLFPSCLECPLPRCIEDMPFGKAGLRISSRNVEMLNLRKQSWLIREIAAHFSVSDRTVYRSLSLFKSPEVCGEGVPLSK
jgi:hypothetical protein